jgi:hypothetical protein
MTYSTAQSQKPPKIATVYRNYAAIVPADNLPIGPFEGLYVGGAGNIAVARMDGTIVSFVGVLAGTSIPIEFQGVNATGTSAPNLAGLG